VLSFASDLLRLSFFTLRRRCSVRPASNPSLLTSSSRRREPVLVPHRERTRPAATVRSPAAAAVVLALSLRLSLCEILAQRRSTSNSCWACARTRATVFWFVTCSPTACC
jgi:hypothetical protein